MSKNEIEDHVRRTWQDCLVLVSNCFSTQTSYENQTKKSITNRFIQEAMTEFLRSSLQVYFLENKPDEAQTTSPSRCSSTSAAARRPRTTRLNAQKEADRQSSTSRTACRNLSTAAVAGR